MLTDSLPDWTGETVVCIASGPSLVADDVEYCRGKARVIAINDNWRLAPWCDMLYAGDKDWWLRYWDEGVSDLSCHKVSQDRQGHDTEIKPGVVILAGAPGYTLCSNRWHLHWGGNSGFHAIQVAYHCGCRRVLLLGYDMKKGSNNERHWFGNHPQGLHKESPYWMWLQAFKVAAAQTTELGLTIINCSRDTAIKWIPRAKLQEIL